MTTLRDFMAGGVKGLAAMAAAATGYFAHLADLAATFHALRPLGSDGWAISTYGVMLAPAEHRRAVENIHDLAHASSALETAWSSAELREAVCSIVPWIYRPEDRAIGLKRQELLERASARFDEGLYEEAVLLVYSQVDGLFLDRAESASSAYGRVFSARPVREAGTGAAIAFADIVKASKTMVAVDEAFFLAAREAITASVRQTTLDDHPSRHGVLHGRVLGFGNRRRATQAFAFLAGALELLAASWEELPLSEAEAYDLPVTEAPAGLRILLNAMLFSQVRSVYLAISGSSDSDVLFAIDQPNA